MNSLPRIQLILSGVAFGFLGWFGKTAYAAGITPGELLALRFTTSAALLGAWLSLPGVRRPALPRPTLKICLALGAFGYAVFSSCYFNALKGLSASLTVLLLYLYPVGVTLGGWLIFKDVMTPVKWLALALSLSGLAALVWGEWAVSSGWALLYGVGAAVVYSGYILAGRKWLKGHDTSLCTFWIQVGAGTTLSIVHFRNLERPVEIFADNALLILGMAFVCSWLAMSLFIKGVQNLRSAEVAILSMSEPISALVIAVLLLNESISWVQAAGGAAVLCAMVMIARANNPARLGN